MTKAPEAALHELHGLIATALAGIIRDGVTVLDRQGNAVTIAAPANYLKEAREFLKDNGVTALPGANKPLQDLAATLPFPGGDESEFDSIRVSH